MVAKSPSQELLKSWLSYNKETGEFYWKRKFHTGKSRVGELAGSLNKKTNYVLIQIYGFRQIGAHRLAWIYQYGDIPADLEIDHIDGNPRNNAISNLRLATSAQQKMNKRVQKNSRSKLKGAYYHAVHKGKKWRSQIKVDGRYIFLGYFHTAWEAHLAYCEAAPRYFGAFARAA